VHGFSLVEIAIALIIIGLLLGGLMRSQELWTAARVRNFLAQQDGAKVAFFAFQDRYRALPGDYAFALSTLSGATQNGNGNGRIEAGTVPDESILAWEHLSRAGILSRAFTYNATESATTSPVNPYGGFQRLVSDAIYGDSTLAMLPRHNLKLGPKIPAYIAVEMDRKADDGLPYSGSLQFSIYQGNAALPPNPVDCIVSANAGSPATWRASGGGSNCGAAVLF
jgi:prepilin-type N-terminal cleavage/methylation domain-containing protein